ncbi:MAG: radical SAM protein [Clostridia bacterium]|nr:radical SAM protein [Clostridia bacterium]
MDRYSVIREKRKREIVLLRGSGCKYKKCAFCDYYHDSNVDAAANFALNATVLGRVTGEYGDLEVINSGSVFELDRDTIALIKKVCRDKHIGTVHFESHFMYADKIPALRREFDGVALKMKLGLETFDYDYREGVLCKGIRERDPEKIARHFDEANFLFGLRGQTAAGMTEDIKLGLKYFERICINIMCENSTAVRPDAAAIAEFMQAVYPVYKDDPRIDILIQNTDFGVGD